MYKIQENPSGVKSLLKNSLHNIYCAAEGAIVHNIQ